MLPKIDLPTYGVSLNSQKRELKLHPMTVKQNKILLVARESDSPNDVLEAITNVLDKCVIDDFNINTLPRYDITWLYIKLRAASVSNKVEFAIADDMDETINLQVNLSDVAAPKIKKRKDIINVGKDVAIKLKDVPISTYLSKDFADALEKNDEDKMWSLLCVNSIESIATGDTMKDINTISTDELIEWIDQLPATVFDEFRQFINDAPAVEHTIKYKDSAGKDQEFTLATISDFFLL